MGVDPIWFINACFWKEIIELAELIALIYGSDVLLFFSSISRCSCVVSLYVSWIVLYGIQKSDWNNSNNISNSGSSIIVTTIIHLYHRHTPNCAHCFSCKQDFHLNVCIKLTGVFKQCARRIVESKEHQAYKWIKNR